MTKPDAISELRMTIQKLELKKIQDALIIKEHAKLVYESLKPAKLIKNVIHDITTLPDFKGDLLKAGMSLAAGYLSKKAAVGSSHNPLKKIAGTLLQLAVTNLVSKNSDSIKSIAAKLIQNFLAKRQVEE